MRKKRYVRPTAKEHRENLQEFGARLYVSFIALGDAIEAGNRNQMNASRVSQSISVCYELSGMRQKTR